MPKGVSKPNSGGPPTRSPTWEQAARLDVHDAEAPNAAWPILCLRQGRLDEARTFQSSAVHRQPDSPKQHAFLARVLERRGETTEADAQIAIAQRLVEQVNMAAER